MPLARESHLRQNVVANQLKAKCVRVVNNKDRKRAQTRQKRPADAAGDDGPTRKRTVLGDVTNNTKTEIKRTDNNDEKPTNEKLNTGKSCNENPVLIENVNNQGVRKSQRLSDKRISSNIAADSLEITLESSKEDFSTPTAESEETKFETPAADCEAIEINSSSDNDEVKVPEGVDDFDKEMENDPFSASLYAQDIFRHFKEREIKFKVDKYLDSHREITKHMRAILVDWMAEVQESFEMNHETLYLAVKLVDTYLSRVNLVPKSNLQLLASTALLVAAKFDERCPPAIADFVYICDEAYTANQLIRTEINLLKCIDYDLGYPLSYTFLRRYARCSKQTMETLTLARYILELSLMDYNMVDVLDSRLAAATMSLALQMSKLEAWNKTLEYYSGYKLCELADLITQLNAMVKKAGRDGLKTIHSKYSHKIFYEVAKKSAVDELQLA